MRQSEHDSRGLMTQTHVEKRQLITDFLCFQDTTGCIGMCVKEPLIDIEQAGKPRVTYGNVHPNMVARLIEEHLINGNAVEEWAVGRLSR